MTPQPNTLQSIKELIAIHCPNAKTILFYTHIPRAFRSTFIGYLFDVCQTYSTILLSEELDKKIRALLEDKTLFPKLEKIIPVNRGDYLKVKPFTKNKYLSNLAKQTLYEYKPDVVITGLYTLFEFYLMRFAKREKILRISLQSAIITYKSQTSLLNDLMNAETRFPRWIPLKLRMLLTKIRKHIGYLFYFWILPLSVRQNPFLRGTSSLHHIQKNDLQYQIAWTPRDCQIFKANGMPANKIYIVPHPLAQPKIKEIFDKIDINQGEKHHDKKNITLLIPANWGINRQTLSVIAPEEKLNQWFKITKIIHETITNGWHIYIKPHPYFADPKYANDFSAIKNKFKKITNGTLLDPLESAENYIVISDTVIGLPVSTSTVLFTTALRYKEKLIISLDTNHDLCGDFYKDYPGILYIDDLQKLKKVLKKCIS